MMEKEHTRHIDRSALNYYVRQIFELKRYSIPALILPGLGVMVSSYIPPLIIAAIIRDFHGHIPESYKTLLPYIALITLSWVIGEGLVRLAYLGLNRTASRAIKQLYLIAMQEMLKKDTDFFNNNFAGSLTKKVIGFSRSFELFNDTLSLNVLGNLLPLLFAAVVLWTINPLLVLVLFGMLFLTIIAITPFVIKRRRLVRQREVKSNIVAGHIADVIGNVATVKVFAHEQKENARHDQLVSDFMAVTLKSWDYHILRVDSNIALFFVLTNLIGLTCAMLLTKSGDALAAVFLTFSYFGQATRILFEFNRTFRNLENALTEATEFTDLLIDQPAIQDVPHAKKLAVKKGGIVFDAVSFGYPEAADTLIFDNLNLHIKAGEKLAFVGHSGGGKSTITKLLLRLSDVTKGHILIDGQDITMSTINSVRSSIAYVPQDPAMFHRSIMENIRYGRLDASDEEVIEAARRAHALEFIHALPQGFDTLVGERGVKLSGGQRQRVAIARAILKNAPILVLDEATSALDSESEKMIQDSLTDLMQNRTSIVIAHRLSTIAKLDRILVLESGEIVEDGTHAELLKVGGIYAKLWQHQSGGFIED